MNIIDKLELIEHSVTEIECEEFAKEAISEIKNLRNEVKNLKKCVHNFTHAIVELEDLNKTLLENSHCMLNLVKDIIKRGTNSWVK